MSEGVKWEYKAHRIENQSHTGSFYLTVIATSEPELREVNELGADGWELVAVQNDWAYFKRPVIEPLEPSEMTRVRVSKGDYRTPAAAKEEWEKAYRGTWPPEGDS